MPINHAPGAYVLLALLLGSLLIHKKLQEVQEDNCPGATHALLLRVLDSYVLMPRPEGT